MRTEAGHPSYLELDRLAFGEPSPALREHLRDCEACAAHLRALEAVQVTPAWARALAAPPRPSRWRWAWGGGLAFAAMAAASVLLLAPLQRGEAGYVGVKGGGPVVVVHMRHGERVEAWDVRSARAPALVPGDSIRLQVAAAGYRQVWVGAPGDGGAMQELYQGALPEGGGLLLPLSWQVDAAGEAERLVLVFSQGPLEGAALQKALSARSRDGGAWVTELSLPKARAP